MLVGVLSGFGVGLLLQPFATWWLHSSESGTFTYKCLADSLQPAEACDQSREDAGEDHGSCLEVWRSSTRDPGPKDKNVKAVRYT